MPKKLKLFATGLFLALVGIACFVLVTASAKAEEEDKWEPGDPYPPVSGIGWSIDEEGVLRVDNDAAWQDYLANGPGEWIWEYDDGIMDERVQKLVIGKNVTTLSIYDPKRMNDDSVMEVDYLLSKNAGIYEPYVSVAMQDPKCMPPKIEVEEGNEVFSVVNGLLINNMKKSVVLSEIDVSDVIIPDGIETIEAWAFYYRNIKSISLPDSLRIIGAAAFANCENLTSVTLPDSVVKLETCAFYCCSNLRDITFSRNVKTIEGMAFSGCAIEEITIPSSLEKIDFMMFEGCSSLKSVHLPEGLTNIDNYAFSGCKLLTEINFPSSLTYIGYHAFEDCTNWKIIILPDTVNSIGEDAFLGCKPILVQLPKQLSVKAVSPEERGWSMNLEEEDPSTRLLGIDYVETLIVSGSSYSLGAYAVKGADQIVFLYKPPADVHQFAMKLYSQNVFYLDKYASSWDSLDKTAWSSLSLHKLTRSQVNEIIQSSEDTSGEDYIPKEKPVEEASLQVFEKEGWSMSSDGVLTLRSNEGWLNWLRQDEFEHPNILVIGKDVTELKLYDMSGTISIQDFYQSEDIIGYAENGSAIYSYAESSFITPMKIYLDPENKSFIYAGGMLVNIRTMEIVLSDQTLPSEIVIPEGIRSIGNGAFQDRKLDSIQLPATLETIGVQAFDNSTLTRIELPNSVTSIGKFAFRDCDRLSSIKLSENLKLIEEGTFWESGLKQVVLPDGIRELGKDAFFRCPNLEHVQLSESLKKIGSSAFQECEQLMYIWFSKQIESIGPEAFFGCKNLKEVTLPNSLKVIGINAFKYCELTLLRIPPELHIYEFDWDQQNFRPGVNVKDDLNLGIESVETIVFSGSDYDLGKIAFNDGKSIYFQMDPPANVSEWLPKKTTGNIFCSETYMSEWKSSNIANWVRTKIEFVPAAKIDDWVENLINATPKPTAAIPTLTPSPTPWPTPMPRPTASPAVTAEPEKQAADPILFVFAGVLALVITGIAVVAVKGKKTKK